MKWVIFALIAAFVLHGCSGKTVYVDRVVEVKVPVKCNTKEVQPAKQGVNDAETLADIIRERNELREASYTCK